MRSFNQYGFTAAQVADVVRLLKSGSGKYVVSQTHRILHNRNWLIISKLHDNNAASVLIEEQDDSIVFADQKLIIEYPGIPHKLDTSNSVALLDAGEISFPLLLRKWKKGDYFYPLGMQKKKKLSNFFIDNKMSLTQKENTWVVEMDKKIIWVVGQRIDDRFKITGNTVKVLKLTVSSA
jgi:tRNA(Ile)-lysidine synthase